MQPVLLIDFGSTYTKVTAVDLSGPTLLGTAAHFTTVETDINEGLNNALGELSKKVGTLDYTARYACSSAAGGLRMITSGLVPELTAEAARLASLGAGAKVIKVYAYELTEEDIEEIDALKPDIFLLTGGTDGGNRAYIEQNARMLAQCKTRFPILVAGNRSSTTTCLRILEGREVTACPNVMPKLGALNIEPTQNEIRALFLERIIKAKGLSTAAELIDGILMPTPAAVLSAMELLSGGTKTTPGLGELVGVDLGGATTDIYSIAAGHPDHDAVMKGLPEPYAKRTVEGDIGMRYSALGVLEAVGVERLAELSGLSEAQVLAMTEHISAQPDSLPDTEDYAALDYAIACAAIETAVTRHAGHLEEIYTPTGPAYMQMGKNLTGVTKLVVTGGAIIHNQQAPLIARHAFYTESAPFSLKPKTADIYIDRRYILASMGLLGQNHPDAALTIMKKELEYHGTAE
jgi:uncharacterized protein (TIGR01319 family)